jgi:hypothetical protein
VLAELWVLCSGDDAVGDDVEMKAWLDVGVLEPEDSGLVSVAVEFGLVGPAEELGAEFDALLDIGSDMIIELEAPVLEACIDATFEFTPLTIPLADGVETKLDVPEATIDEDIDARLEPPDEADVARLALLVDPEDAPPIALAPVDDAKDEVLITELEFPVGTVSNELIDTVEPAVGDWGLAEAEAVDETLRLAAESEFKLLADSNSEPVLGPDVEFKLRVVEAMPGMFNELDPVLVTRDDNLAVVVVVVMLEV